MSPQELRSCEMRTRRFTSRQRRTVRKQALRHVYYPCGRRGLVRCSPRFRRCSNVVRNSEAVSSLREIRDFPLAVRTRRVLTTLPDYVRQAARIRRILATSRESVALSNDDKMRATAVVAECRVGRSGTLRTACKGKPPAESGAVLRTLRVLMGRTRRPRLVDAVSTSDASSDTETGSRSKGATRLS